MSEQKETPPPKPQPSQPPKPSIPLEEGRKTGLPPVDKTPSMPPVKPPKEKQ